MYNHISVWIIIASIITSLDAMDHHGISVTRQRSSTIDTITKNKSKNNRHRSRSRSLPQDKCTFGNPEILEKSLDGVLACTISNCRVPLLHRATLAPNKELIIQLLSLGADVNERDCAGRTPLHIAAALGNEELIDLFIAQGSDCSIVDNNGCKPGDMVFLANVALKLHFS